MANFLTLLALWYSLDFGEMVQDKGTADVQRMLTARATLGRNRGGPCHEMADSIQTWAAKVLAGDRRAIARAISAVEAGDTPGTELLKKLFPATGKAEVIGVTGSPGAGKSTLVEKLAGEYRRPGARVGIIAVDPTSPFSGGALLGDRIRMQSLASDKEIYIRSMATRGQLGGLAPTTQDVVTILDAAGCEVVLIETVGVGQDEVEIARLADATALLLVPGMGDDVQTFKAGVMEIADLYVINKADLPGAERVEQEVAAMLSMASLTDGWRPPIVKTIATTGSGIAEVRQALEQFRSFQDQSARKEKRRRGYWRSRLLELLRRNLFETVARERLRDGSLEQLVDDLLQHRADPYSLVERIVAESVRQVSGVRRQGNSEF
ncbi:MAG: methylmalonyl Co-A mutase-associated GTPase MeaB [Terriglobia bacterium]